MTEWIRPSVRSLFPAATVAMLAFFSSVLLVYASDEITPDFAPPVSDCRTVAETVRLRQGSLAFPRSGRFVTESHYAAEGESFGGAHGFPHSVTDGIHPHLQASCALLRGMYGFGFLSSNCAEVYEQHWDREWTPPEHGAAGATSRGTERPSRAQEMWQGNMMYARNSLPAPGTKYILTYPETGRSVVVSFGHEIGPSSAAFLGGVVPEVHWYLGSQNKDRARLTMGRAADQSLPYGPVHCRTDR